MKRKTVISFLGVNGASASALAIRANPSARLILASMKSILEKVKALSPELNQDDTVYITGVGCAGDVDAMKMALNMMTGQGARVFWFGIWPDFIAKAKACQKLDKVNFITKEYGGLGSMIAEHFKMKQNYDLVLAGMADGRIEQKTSADIKAIKQKEPSQQTLQILYENAFIRFATFDDHDAIPQCIKKMAFPETITSDEKDELSRLSLEHPRILLGKSEPVRRLKETIVKIAKADYFDVLITGESGTGKEIVARLLHEHSPRRSAPFIPVSCANFNDQLFESNLFGHVKGAFTGAHKDVKGLFDSVGKGTIFLDEIGELPMNLQARLLRVLQERSYFPVGSTTETRTDARVVCATNRDLWHEVQQGRFRADLFYRLEGLKIQTPSLREHASDIPIIAKSIMSRYCSLLGRPVRRLKKDEESALKAYSWPGNVRDLENVIRQALVLENWSLLHNPGYNRNSNSNITPTTESLTQRYDQNGYDSEENVLSLEEVEKRHISYVYNLLGRNKNKTARALKIVVNTLKSKIEKYGLE